MPTNSLAAEVFNCLAKDHRAKNSACLTQQASQSSDFIKKVKQKLTKQLPGSTIDSCLQSDSEIESMLNNPSLRFSKLTNCPTPDSIFSTGSGSVYSNLLGRSSSFHLPEKLQIVKPLEGSQTLQHWQQLATPNLGCLFETRPGISIKGACFSENAASKSSTEKKEGADECFYLFDENEDDGVNMDMYDEEENDEFYFKNINDDNYADFEGSKRILSPSKFELLSRLLENDEKEKSLSSDEAENNNSDGFLVGLFKNISTRYFRNAANSEMELEKKRNELDDPDTPPSSPINLPNSNSSLFYDVFETAKLKLTNYFQNLSKPSEKEAPTPPGTPTAELADENEQFVINKETPAKTQNFFDQIVNKLSLFSFKSVSQAQTDANNNEQASNFVVYKPSPVYFKSNKLKTTSYSLDSLENVASSSMDKSRTEFFSIKEDEDTELVEIEKNAATNKLCSTPPPSPSKFSPPLAQEQDVMNEEEMKKSAFVKVASLNPYINKSIDLESLLGSLSSLKRNQRLCKY